MIITNFKTYESATAENAVKLARIHEEVADELNADIRICVQATDIAAVSDAVTIPVYAQHVDYAGYGSSTGHIIPEAVQLAGAGGTILNHSERRLDKETLKKTIVRCKELGLFTIVCAETPEEGASFLKFNPDLIAVEPPELIGGDISVSTAKPEIIKNAVKLIGGDKLLVGAGVKNGKDVKIAIKLGARGVLLASGVTKASNPKAVLMDLAKGLKD